MTTRILRFTAIALFVAGAILFFFGLDSEASPASTRLCTAGFFCIIGSAVLTVVEWLRKNHGRKNRP